MADIKANLHLVLRRLVPVVSLLLLLSSCVLQKHSTPAALTDTSPADTVVSVPVSKYVIQAGDELEVIFLDHSDFNRIMDVRPDGYLSMPIVGEVRADGLTVPELTDKLYELYNQELNNPNINVIVHTFSSNVVFVGGDVKEPSAIYFDNKITVLQAIALAGGYNTKTAIIDDVLVIRRAPGKPVQRYKVNLRDIMTGNDLSQDFYLYQYDTIYIKSRE